MKVNDSPHVARQQRREQPEPSERVRPIPLVVAAVTLAMVVTGVAYLFFSESFGESAFGDRRTLADLAAPAAGGDGKAVDGLQVFTANCVACHQATGRGLPGVFPPLDGSEWARGDERVVANILLHGVTGEITVAGNTFNGAMPPFAHLPDAELAAVATYVRGAWSNKAAPVKPELFAAERKASTRSTPFKGGAELEALAGERR